MSRHVAVWSLLSVLALAGGCQVSPATGQRSFNVLSQGEEIRLGQQAAPQFLNDNGGELPSARALHYVRDLGVRLAQVSERPDLPWEFHVLNSDVLNAFSLPGGKVFISRGLLAKLGSEAELAGVLGHEIGHVTDQHIGRQMTQALGIQLVAVGLGIAGEYAEEDWLRVLGVGAQVGGTVYLLKYSRDQENTADDLGLRYMTRLGYNPVGLLRVLEVLEGASGNAGTLEILSTHPDPGKRIDAVNASIRQRYPDYADAAKWKVNATEYNANVLAELARLPPAPKAPAAAGGAGLQRRR